MCRHKTLSSASAKRAIICCFVYWLSLNDALDILHGMQLCLSLQSWVEVGSAFLQKQQK